VRANVVASALLLAGIVLGARTLGATEQTITPLTPPDEQRIERLGGESGQNVEAIASADDTQRIDVPVPPSPTAKKASTAGKFVLGVAAAGISLGAMAASLIFL
jgi:hypothetical protein